jgi:hypothetical protein
MDNLSDLPQDIVDVLDKSLVRYEFEIKEKLQLHGLSDTERQSLESDLSLILQIYSHLLDH